MIYLNKDNFSCMVIFVLKGLQTFEIRFLTNLGLAKTPE